MLEFERKQQKKSIGDMFLEASVNVLYGIAAMCVQVMTATYAWNAIIDVGHYSAPRATAATAVLAMFLLQALTMKNQPGEPELPSAELRKQTLARMFTCFILAAVTWLIRSIAL